ncbi:hypothetical protein [Sulfurimonas sp.]|uniref:hypothetical protein n=1 Tax=Sulfurimonas sp. TaxID=2022749 RepID=UPI002AB09063|nr:hypothetical protein [Sulfurimonas sp.]
MSNGFDKLKSIGAQKIHEQTHIARHNAQAILHENFEKMTKIQALGFISILEREYGVDLTSLKAKAEEFFHVEESVEVPEVQKNTKVFVAPTKKKNYTLVYVGIALLIFVVAVFFTLDLSSTAAIKTSSHSIDNSAIESARENIKGNIFEEEKVEDKNNTLEVVVLKKDSDVLEVLEVEKSFKIIPKSQLWIGYIDLESYTKKQKLFKGELDIDPNKDWILTLGHGYVKVVINGEVTEFTDKLNIRLLYKDSKISKISFKEFKELNRGNKW